MMKPFLARLSNGEKGDKCLSSISWSLDCVFSKSFTVNTRKIVIIVVVFIPFPSLYHYHAEGALPKPVSTLSVKPLSQLQLREIKHFADQQTLI